MREHGDQAGLAGEYLAEHVETGVTAAQRPVSTVHDDRDARVGDHAPRRVEQRVARIAGADLDVRLHAAGAGAQRRVQIPATSGSG